MEIGPQLIAYDQPTEATQPGQGAFHHPAVSSQPLARLNPQRAIRFERRGTKEKPVFWVVLLYRDALRMIQGAAEHSSRHSKSWFPGVGEAALLP
jgi:hypothetical protein